MELYIHLPFCKSKCYYCNFNSRQCTDNNLISAYVDAINKEINLAGEKFHKSKINTIYIGGGTPSFIDSKHIESIISAIYKNFNLDLSEFTIECNPESVDNEKLSFYKSLGINRVSMGVQSLNDNNLKSVGRIHTSKDALHSLDLITKHFDNFSVDLIIGLPYDTKEIVRSEVDTLTKIVPHISMYELQLEEGTILYKKVKNKEIIIPDEDTQVDLFEVAYDKAYKNGFYRYEVSNFSKPNFESIHNTGYWLREEYLGIGAGASSFIKTEDGITLSPMQVRFSSHGNPNEYILGLYNSKTYMDIPRVDLELLNEDQIRYEEIMLGLRTKKGIKYKLIEDKLNDNPEIRDYFTLNNENIALTDNGFQIMNYILGKLL